MYFSLQLGQRRWIRHSTVRLGKIFIELAIKCAIGTRLFPSRLIILGPHIGKWRPKLQLSYFPTYSLSQCLRIAVKKVHCARCYWDLRKCFNPHLHGRGTTVYDTHSFEWTFLLKFLSTKIVKQFVFLVQSIVIIHMFLNLWNNNAF